MAKTSKIVKNNQRREIVARYAERRQALRMVLRDSQATQQEREAAQAALAKLPRDASPTRLRNRDIVDGRPRGYLRKAGISRIRFREMAHRGELPGISKASW